LGSAWVKLADTLDCSKRGMSVRLRRRSIWWNAAAYLVDDESFEGVQHGVDDSGGTLCGIPQDKFAIVRNPFWGQRAQDCPKCALHLVELAKNAASDS
jgi:hypothetical protein